MSDFTGPEPGEDVKFFVVFQPKGAMSPTYAYNYEVQQKAWDVAYSPLLYPHTEDDEKTRRASQTKRLRELVREYADYAPGKAYKDSAIHGDDVSKDIMHALGHKKPPKVPSKIKELRFDWTVQPPAE